MIQQQIPTEERHQPDPEMFRKYWPKPQAPPTVQQQQLDATPTTSASTSASSTANPVQSMQMLPTAASSASYTLPSDPQTFKTTDGKVLSVRWGKILKGNFDFFCFRCQKPFTTKNDCVRHETQNCPLLEESKKKKYICDQCQEKRSSKQLLREHIAQEHTKEYLYKCKSCGKQFYKHTALNFHKRSCLKYLCGN